MTFNEVDTPSVAKPHTSMDGLDRLPSKLPQRIAKELLAIPVLRLYYVDIDMCNTVVPHTAGTELNRCGEWKLCIQLRNNTRNGPNPSHACLQSRKTESDIQRKENCSSKCPKRSFVLWIGQFSHPSDWKPKVGDPSSGVTISMSIISTRRARYRSMGCGEASFDLRILRFDMVKSLDRVIENYCEKKKINGGGFISWCTVIRCCERVSLNSSGLLNIPRIVDGGTWSLVSNVLKCSKARLLAIGRSCRYCVLLGIDS